MLNRYKCIGKIRSKKSEEIPFSVFGIGLEKLDRDLAIPDGAYNFIANTGVKYARLQSGWAKTEKKEGFYDFRWLEKVVDELIARGIEPWICLCYGNPIYSEDAKKYFGAVGVPPVETEREKVAWRNYCKAIVNKFKGRVSKYEVWNEPDGQWCWKNGPNGKEYGEFAVETCKAVKEADENAYVIVGALALRYNLIWLNDAFSTGMSEYADAFSYHHYSADVSVVCETVSIFKEIMKKYGKVLDIIQGEAGAPSEHFGAGALCNGNWTEEKQAKVILRRIVEDLRAEVKFTSTFTALDMVEALNGVSGDKDSHLDYGYFGLLKSEFNEEGVAVGGFTPKKSYYALQCICSLLSDAEMVTLPIFGYYSEYNQAVFGNSEKSGDIVSAGFRKKNGATAYCYYKPTDVMTTDFEGVVSFIASGCDGQARIIDPMDGKVYEIPEKNIVRDSGEVVRYMFIPIKDYPLFLVFGDFS